MSFLVDSPEAGPGGDAAAEKAAAEKAAAEKAAAEKAAAEKAAAEKAAAEKAAARNGAAARKGQAFHPLAPLTADEIEAASAAVRHAHGLKESARFVYISLDEPSKHDIIAFESGTGPRPDRLVRLIIRERAERATYEAVVPLPEGGVHSYRRVDGVPPSVMFEEFMAAEDLVRQDPRWQEAMRKRGIEDFSLCMIDPWSTPNVEPGVGPDDGRFVSPLTWTRSPSSGSRTTGW